MDIETLLIRLQGDQTSFQKMMTSATLQLDKLVLMGKSFGILMAANLGISSFTGIITNAVKTSMHLEQVRVSFETMLGSAGKAKNMLQAIQSYSDVTPFQAEPLRHSAQMLMNYGIAAEDVMPTLRRLGDVSQGDQNKLNGLSYAFAQMSARGHVAGDDLRQMVNWGFNPLQEMARTSKVSISELTDKMHSGQITVEMLNESFRTASAEGGRFFGAMDKQSQTMQGLWSTLQEKVAMLLVDLGDVIIESGNFKDVLKDVIQLAETLTATVHDMKDGVGILQTVFKASMQGWASSIDPWLKHPTVNLQPVKNDLKEIDDLATKMFQSPAEALRAWETRFSAIQQNLMAGGPGEKAAAEKLSEGLNSSNFLASFGIKPEGWTKEDEALKPFQADLDKLSKTLLQLQQNQAAFSIENLVKTTKDLKRGIDETFKKIGASVFDEQKEKLQELDDKLNPMFSSPIIRTEKNMQKVIDKQLAEMAASGKYTAEQLAKIAETMQASKAAISAKLHENDLDIKEMEFKLKNNPVEKLMADMQPAQDLLNANRISFEQFNTEVQRLAGIATPMTDFNNKVQQLDFLLSKNIISVGKYNEEIQKASGNADPFAAHRVHVQMLEVQLQKGILTQKQFNYEVAQSAKQANPATAALESIMTAQEKFKAETDKLDYWMSKKYINADQRDKLSRKAQGDIFGKQPETPFHAALSGSTEAMSRFQAYAEKNRLTDKTKQKTPEQEYLDSLNRKADVQNQLLAKIAGGFAAGGEHSFLPAPTADFRGGVAKGAA